MRWWTWFIADGRDINISNDRRGTSRWLTDQEQLASARAQPSSGQRRSRSGPKTKPSGPKTKTSASAGQGKGLELRPARARAATATLNAPLTLVYVAKRPAVHRAGGGLYKCIHVENARFCLGVTTVLAWAVPESRGPFDTLKTSNMKERYRLQNNDPAPAIAATPATPGAAAPSFGPRSELQNAITAGVQGLQKLIHPGADPWAEPPGAVPVSRRWPTHAALSDLPNRAQQQVLDNELKEDLGALMGDKEQLRQHLRALRT